METDVGVPGCAGLFVGRAPRATLRKNAAGFVTGLDEQKMSRRPNPGATVAVAGGSSSSARRLQVREGYVRSPDYPHTSRRGPPRSPDIRMTRYRCDLLLQHPFDQDTGYTSQEALFCRRASRGEYAFLPTVFQATAATPLPSCAKRVPAKSNIFSVIHRCHECVPFKVVWGEKGGRT